MVEVLGELMVVTLDCEEEAARVEPDMLVFRLSNDFFIMMRTDLAFGEVVRAFSIFYSQ